MLKDRRERLIPRGGSSASEASDAAAFATAGGVLLGWQSFSSSLLSTNGGILSQSLSASAAADGFEAAAVADASATPAVASAFVAAAAVADAVAAETVADAFAEAGDGAPAAAFACVPTAAAFACVPTAGAVVCVATAGAVACHPLSDAGVWTTFCLFGCRMMAALMASQNASRDADMLLQKSLEVKKKLLRMDPMKTGICIYDFHGRSKSPRAPCDRSTCFAYFLLLLF